jgi:hypothetical protein
VSLESSLYDYLTGQTSISSVVSTRVYPLKRPQGTALPAITYKVISKIFSHRLSGSDGTARARVQISCFSRNYLQALEMAEALRLCLDGYSTKIGDFGDLHLYSALQDQDNGTYTLPVASTDSGVYEVACDYFFHYRVSIPAFVEQFSPEDLAGLLYWVKADSITSLDDGDPVMTWTDQSGNAHTTTGTALTAPTYKANIINSKPVVRFAGNQVLRTNVDDPLEDFTVFVVFRK